MFSNATEASTCSVSDFFGNYQNLNKIVAYKNTLSFKFLNIRKLRDGAADGLDLWDLFIDGELQI